MAYCLHLYGLFLLKYPHECLNVGIIAPYRAQRLALKRAFQGRYGDNTHVEISTIDGFQGREKDVVFFSTVRAPSEGATGDSKAKTNEGTSNSKEDASAGDKESTAADSDNISSTNINSDSRKSDRSGSAVGFLKDPCRLNVAITRAKYGLWVVGHGPTLQTDKEWSSLLRYLKVSALSLSLALSPFSFFFFHGCSRTVSNHDRTTVLTSLSSPSSPSLLILLSNHCGRSKGVSVMLGRNK